MAEATPLGSGSATRAAVGAAPTRDRAVPWIAGVLGLAATLAVLLTLTGPGLTVDEPLDVRPGRTYLATLRAQGLGFFRPDVIDRVFRDNAEHPPLGRWLLGIASTLGQPFEVVLRGGPDPVGIYTVAGRAAPALAFGVLVGAVAWASGRWSGRSAAWAAGLSLVLMPRVFAHAHIAALDTFITLFWTLGWLSLVGSTRARPGRVMLTAVGAGLVWGLALLTKIHAWFLPVVALGWLVSQLPARRAALAFFAWLVTGLLVFIAGWPWLWADPWVRFRAFLGTGVVRTPIRVLYFGTVFDDRAVPWHYPWFYFVATVPVGLLALGVWGAVRGWRAPETRATTRLALGVILLFLALFSTKVPVYDGERLFLMVFPALAILVGQGFASAWRGLARRGRVVLLGAFAGQAVGLLSVHPFGLSYYNALVGGLPGAERLGLELTYWGDSVDDVLLDALAARARPGESAALAPTLAPEQGKISTTRRLARLHLVLQDGEAAGTTDWLVVARRSTYWSPAVRERLARDEWVAVRSRQGVWLGALLRRRDGRIAPWSSPTKPL